MIKPIVIAFFDRPTYTYSYVVSDPETKEAVIIDPVLNFDYSSGRTATKSADEIIAYVKEHELVIDWILETHAHADHLSSFPYLQEQLGGRGVIGKHITDVQSIFSQVFNFGSEFACDGSQFDCLLEDGETFKLGNIEGRVIHTPGHTPACLTFVIGDAVFVGDTVFMPDYGTARCDFPGGDAKTLYHSIQKIFALPESYRVFLCHDYLPKEGRTEYGYETTIAEQKYHNVHIHEGISESEFVAMREARDAGLKPPKLIIPSIQVNIRAGHFPPAEDNGQVYLKVPVDKL